MLALIEKDRFLAFSTLLDSYCKEHSDKYTYDKNSYFVLQDDKPVLGFTYGGALYYYIVCNSQELLDATKKFILLEHGTTIIYGVSSEKFDKICRARSDVDIRNAPEHYFFHKGLIRASIGENGDAIVHWFGDDPEVTKHALSITKLIDESTR